MITRLWERNQLSVYSTNALFHKQLCGYEVQTNM